MKITYWVAENISERNSVYNVRGKTRKAVIATLTHGDVVPEDYEKPRKVTIEYANAYDLVNQIMGSPTGTEEKPWE